MYQRCTLGSKLTYSMFIEFICSLAIVIELCLFNYPRISLQRTRSMKIVLFMTMRYLPRVLQPSVICVDTLRDTPFGNLDSRL